MKKRKRRAKYEEKCKQKDARSEFSFHKYKICAIEGKSRYTIILQSIENTPACWDKTL